MGSTINSKNIFVSGSSGSRAIIAKIRASA
jgi:hypothetical protein